MSAEYLIEADRFTGDFAPMLAKEWSISDDGRTWNFQLEEGVQWHFGYGEFTAEDVVHSMAYYTNDECRASYSDYFRNDPGADVEIINDYEVNMHMEVRPAVDFTYWLSAYRGVPISSKAQWDEGCPNGEADYVQGYCAGGRDGAFAQSARTGPYQFVSFEEGVGWEFEAVDYDHYRVNGEFPIIEIKDVPESATRLAIMLAREGHIAAINRALLQEAVDDGLEVVDSSVTANGVGAIFGGMYHDSSLADAFDDTRPWTMPGETGRMVRMAMNKALDRDAINEAIYDGLGSKQYVYSLSPAFPGGWSPAWDDVWDELYGYDPPAARQLLIDAGFPNGFDFPIPSFPLSGVPEMPDMMEAMAAMWEEIGLRPKLEDWEFSRWREKYRGLDTGCCIYPFRGPAAPMDTRVHFYFSPERFFRAYTSDTITEKKAVALASLDQDAANAIWQEVADEIYFDVGTIPGWVLPVNAVIDPAVVEHYAFLGPNGGNYISLEYTKAVRR
jgi:peptide/nickel transport system substrate-binding protein